ncbi:uncharacterized protein LOC130677576 [Microplitis mediator]|uniref:uncharacterized protein LOC130677576 n=1 Tax=Microplitis mediator TaxID=375433 RepID=UPI0025542E9F|nr:uncharacterized protein LOC130677576 [Microplitis mediator]
MRKKMENENDCDILTPSSEEEIGYCGSNLLRSHINWEKVGYQTQNEPMKMTLISDDTDQQFWAEDELSGRESRAQISKRKRRRSLAHRNRTYRSRSRLNNLSSSSGLSSSRNPATSRRKKRRKKISDVNKPAPSQPSNSSSRSDNKKIRVSKIRIFKMRKK